jgi:hypothetical protein
MLFKLSSPLWPTVTSSALTCPPPSTARRMAQPLQRHVQRIAALTKHRVIDQTLLSAEIAVVEGHTDLIAGRRLAVHGLAIHEQMRVRTIGSRHRLNFCPEFRENRSKDIEDSRTKRPVATSVFSACQRTGRRR